MGVYGSLKNGSLKNKSFEKL